MCPGPEPEESVDLRHSALFGALLPFWAADGIQEGSWHKKKGVGAGLSRSMEFGVEGTELDMGSQV